MLGVSIPSSTMAKVLAITLTRHRLIIKSIRRKINMAAISLEQLRELEGYVASALVDSESGMMLGSDGSGIDLDVAAAGNTEVVRAKRKTANALQLND